jgi:hypothetical protein
MKAADEVHMNVTRRNSGWRGRAVPGAVLVGAAILVGALLLPSSRVGAAPTCGVTADLVPTCGALWGAHSSQGYAALESQIGRKLAIVHDYTDWTGIFPNAGEQTAAAGGRIIFEDWTAKEYSTGQAAATWAQIAAGDQDAQINAEAAALKSFGKRIMVTFQAEPEQSHYTSYGTAAEYVAAWQHIANQFQSDGVTNVVWVWDVEGDVGDHGSTYQTWYPGDAYVNWIMWDPYNWFGCNRPSAGGATWNSFASTVSPMYTWLTTHSGTPGNGDYLSKPWGLAEYGTVEGANPTDKAQWMEDAVSTAQSQFPNLKALVYFDASDSTNGRSCNWTVSSSSDSVAGFAAAGAESYMSATASTVVATTTTTTSTSTTTTTVPVTTTTKPPAPTTTTQPVTTTTLAPPVISGAPVVTNDPATVTVPLGGRVTFYSGATGSPTPTVVWQLSENYGLTWWTLKRHTSPAYTVLHAATADNGWELRAVYTNPNGSVTTSTADLWVTLPTPVVVALG